MIWPFQIFSAAKLTCWIVPTLMLSREALKKLLALIIYWNNGCVSNFRQLQAEWLSVKKQDFLCCIPFSGTWTLLRLLKALLFTSPRSSCKHVLLHREGFSLKHCPIHRHQSQIPASFSTQCPAVRTSEILLCKSCGVWLKSCSAALLQRMLCASIYVFPG